MNPKLGNFPQWEVLRKQIASDEFCAKFYQEIIQHHEELVENHYDLLLKRIDLKELMYEDFKSTLARFPYYTEVWKRYAALVGKLDGLEGKLKVFERCLSVFPYSLELWIEYVNNLIENNFKSNEEIKSILEKGSELIGRHFLSHEYWDIYLNFILEIDGKNSNDYINILLKIIKLPLHQYSRYYKCLMELAPNFSILDLIPKDELDEYITHKFNNEKNADNDSAEIIDSYFNDNFQTIQKLTNEKWIFESKITKFDFDLTLVTEEELTPWIEYIDYEIKRNDLKSGISLFERAVIPTCFIKNIWIKYTRFLIHQKAGNSSIVKVFNRACDQFVPFDILDLRYMYIKYLQLIKLDDESVKNVFISTISKNNTNCDPVCKYISFLLCKTDDKDSFIKDLLTAVKLYEFENYGDNPAVSKKRKLNKPQEDNNYHIYNDDIKVLYDFLTYRTISQLIVSIVRYQWIELSNIEKTRETFEFFFKYELVKCSREYWFSYFKFEYMQGGKHNLTNLINYIKLYSQLAPKDLNLLLNNYKVFMFRNCKIDELVKHKRDIHRIFLETDIESSTHERHFLKIRLSEDNTEETENKRLFKENGHPASICEGIPTTTNPIPLMEPLLGFRHEIPFGLKGNKPIFKSKTIANPLPQFRNVEKANTLLKYNRDSESLI